MKTKRTLIALIVLVLGVTAAGAWLVTRPDPEVVKLQNLRERMFDADDQDRRAARTEFRDGIRNLSDDQRRQFFEAGREQMMARMSERMNSFFSLPPEEQQQELDRRIDQMIEWREQREQRSQSGNDRRGDGQARGGGRRGWQNMSEAQRDERRKRHLDYTDARTRAQFIEFRRMMNERLAARGEPPMRWPHGGGRRR